MSSKNLVFSTLFFSSALAIGGTTAWAQTSADRSASGTERSGGMSERHTGSMTQWSRDDVKQVQDALRGKGYNPGSSDGIMGPRTQTALRQFQRAQNLQATGQLDSNTAGALGISLSSSSMGSSSDMGKSTSSNTGTRSDRNPVTGTNVPREGTGPGSPEGRTETGKIPGSNASTPMDKSSSTGSGSSTGGTNRDRDTGTNASREGTGPTSPERGTGSNTGTNR